MKTMDLTSQQFGRLAVSGFSHRTAQHSYWTCVCECGTIRPFTANNLRRGRATSCGCKRVETLVAKKTHGMSNTKIYRLWRGILSRCNDQGHPKYKDYGGRGIKVCARWRTFANFYQDMGEKPGALTMERVNNDGPYSPNNCRWASRIDQASNTRSNVRITLFGETLSIAHWSRKTGIAETCLRKRRSLGWTDLKTLTTPSRRK